LRDDFVSSYSIDIETDSLTQADWSLQQQERMEFVGTLSSLIQSAVPAVEASPALGPILAQIIKFASVGFKGSSELEGALDTAIKALTEQATQAANAPPEPSPEQIKSEAAKAESDARIAEINAKAAARQQETAAELTFMERKFTMEMSQKAQQHAMEMAHKREMAQLEFQLKREHASIEAEQNQARFVQESVQNAKDSAQSREIAAIDTASSIANATAEAQAKARTTPKEK
jgi:hypothetical protein